MFGLQWLYVWKTRWTLSKVKSTCLFNQFRKTKEVSIFQTGIWRQRWKKFIRNFKNHLFKLFKYDKIWLGQKCKIKRKEGRFQINVAKKITRILAKKVNVSVFGFSPNIFFRPKLARKSWLRPEMGSLRALIPTKMTGRAEATARCLKSSKERWKMQMGRWNEIKMKIKTKMLFFY